MMQADNKNELVCYGYNDDVVRVVCSMYERWKEQPRDLLDAELYGLDVDTKCQAVFGYLIDHVHYRLDPVGKQYVKSPARLLADGQGDCKSLTMFVACCLHCLGVKHIIRFVNFDGSKFFSHVYPVAIDEQGREIILDACETDRHGQPRYDFARPYMKKNDFIFD